MDTHTYIHNWPLQPFSQDYGLASGITHVVCFNFIYKWRNLQFTVDSERQIFEKHNPFQNLIIPMSWCFYAAEAI